MIEAGRMVGSPLEKSKEALWRKSPLDRVGKKPGEGLTGVQSRVRDLQIQSGSAFIKIIIFTSL